MTRHEREVARALSECSFLPGTWEKKFASDMGERADKAPGKPISGRQALCLERLAWKFRRQMPRHLVPAAEPPELPRNGKQPTKIARLPPRRRRGSPPTDEQLDDAIAAMRRVW